MTLAPFKPQAPIITAEQFENMPDTKGYELVDGVLVKKNMSYYSGMIGTAVAGLLRDFCVKTSTGWVVGPEGGFRCFPKSPNRIVFPDVSFVSVQRLPLTQLPRRGYPMIAPDLAVEVISPGDLYFKVVEKVQDYLSVGVQRVWVIDPGTRTVEICRPDGSNTILDNAGELIGEEPLQRFSCKVSELSRPSLRVIRGPIRRNNRRIPSIASFGFLQTETNANRGPVPGWTRPAWLPTPCRLRATMEVAHTQLCICWEMLKNGQCDRWGAVSAA